jgi:arylsulfatase A-like enzyme
MRQFILLLLIISNTFIIAQKRPNIVWVVCEDISPTLSMYGDHTAKTPALNKLAKEGMVYTNAYATVGVCAPSRSAIITGMYPTSIGTMHMRTGEDVFSWGKRVYKRNINENDIEGNPIRQYATVIPEYVKCFPEYLRMEGYYCTNNEKTDYQFAAPITAWDENDGKAHWRNRPDKNTPFFSVFNFGTTHESRIWKNAKNKQTVDPKKVKVTPYFQDTEISRTDIARHYSNIELMDKEVGDIIAQLKEDGLYDNTIIFFYSDHGGPLPRQKRAIYDSGLKVPLIIKDINSKTKGRTDQMISFVDLAPTILSLANIKPPSYIQGKAFLGKFAKNPRDFIYGSSDRFDEATDRLRAVRDKQFLYVSNYYPNKIKYKNIKYRKQMPMMVEMLNLRDQKKLNKIQMQWFETKISEELYDCKSDPHNIKNIADDPKYRNELNKLRKAFLNHQQKYVDLGMIPEAKLINLMWPYNKQPQTSKPIMTQKGHLISLSCDTKGASIAYKISDKPDEKFEYKDKWKLYTKPLTFQSGKYYYVIAERIGYKESETVILKM